MEQNKTDNHSGVESIEPFGCCALYRECSDRMECVHPDREASAHCAYYKNLTSGKIFYGKNAIGFDIEKYTEILESINNLTPNSNNALEFILIDLFEYHRGVSRCVVRTPFLDEISELGLLRIENLESDLPYVMETWNKNGVLRLLQSNDVCFQSFQQAQEARSTERKLRLASVEGEADKKSLDEKLPGEKTKAFMWEWLNHDATVFRGALLEPYRFVLLTPESRQYMEELYHDTLLPSYNTRIYRQSPFAEDGLLTPAKYREEESLRIQLSPGYTRDEKSDLLAKLLNGED